MMYKCNYCGRYLKNEYESCPGCGSTHIEKLNDTGVLKITDVPEGGYKINLNNIKKDNLGGVVLTIMGVVFLVMSATSLISFIVTDVFINSQLEEGVFSISIFSTLFDIPFIIVGILMLVGANKLKKKHKEKIEKIKYLSQHGVLIKNLQYHVKPTGTVINGRAIFCIEVMYKHENGTEIPLTSEGKFDGKLSREDGTVDLLIDPNDISNYFIDFEIY